MYTYSWTSLVAQTVNLPTIQETWVQSLGWEDLLEKGKATHSSILAWRIPEVTKSQTRLSNFHTLHSGDQIRLELFLFHLMGPHMNGSHFLNKFVDQIVRGLEGSSTLLSPFPSASVQFSHSVMSDSL